MSRSFIFLALVSAPLALLSPLGCGSEQTLDQIGQLVETAEPTQNAATIVRPARLSKTSETIRIASFNIQVFGITKLKKPRVMEMLAQVIRRFEVVAIQEIRNKDQTHMSQFLELINADGSQYDYVIGPRLGLGRIHHFVVQALVL